MQNEKFLTLEEAASILRMHPDTLRKALRTKDVSENQASKIGGRWRIHTDALNTLFAESEPRVARRPEIFDEERLRDSFRAHGCREDFIGPLISDVKLIIPLLCRNLKQEEVLAAVIKSEQELSLEGQEFFWKLAIKYLIAWATDEIEEYKRRKGSTDASTN